MAGCSNGGTSGAASNELHITTGGKVGIESLMREFEAQQGVKVTGTYIAGTALNDQLRIQISAGTAPDVFRSAPGTSSPSAVLTLAKEGALKDLSGQKWAQFVPKSFEPLEKQGGSTYAFPAYGQAMLVFYNKSVFKAAGLKPPTTWSEFISLCSKLKAAGKTPLALGLADSYVMQFLPYALAATLVDGNEPDFYQRLKEGQTSFSSSAGWREAFTKFLGLLSEGYTTPKPLGVPSDSTLQSVGKGETAMAVMPSAASPVLAGYLGGDAKMGSFVLPATDDPSQTFVSFTPEFLVVNAKAKNPKAALDFLDFISTPDRIAKLAAETGSIPALTNAPPVSGELNTTVQPYLAKGRTAPFPNHTWPSGEVANALITTGQQVVEGTKTVDDLLAAMDKAYQKSES
jgi:raffinose/stachyose/melibiose transport system substrate-binding protein